MRDLIGGSYVGYCGKENSLVCVGRCAGSVVNGSCVRVLGIFSKMCGQRIFRVFADA